MQRIRKDLLDTPEINIVIFGFLLNFVWENLQIPFFAGMQQKPHWDAVRECTVATFGDVAILIISFWVMASFWRRNWILNPDHTKTAVFTGIALTIAVAVEIAMTRHMHHYSYAPNMPIIPGIGVGLIPFVQWLILPGLLLWFIHRQLL